MMVEKIFMYRGLIMIKCRDMVSGKTDRRAVIGLARIVPCRRKYQRLYSPSVL